MLPGVTQQQQFFLKKAGHTNSSLCKHINQQNHCTSHLAANKTKPSSHALINTVQERKFWVALNVVVFFFFYRDNIHIGSLQTCMHAFSCNNVYNYFIFLWAFGCMCTHGYHCVMCQACSAEPTASPLRFLLQNPVDSFSGIFGLNIHSVPLLTSIQSVKDKLILEKCRGHHIQIRHSCYTIDTFFFCL